MIDFLQLILIVAVVVLTVIVSIQGRRLDRLRSRAKRSMLIGPEHHLRLQKQLYDHIAAMNCRASNTNPRLALEFRSEWGEDTLLYDLFEGKPQGFYIEVGALDGCRNSVSWIFDALGWRGLLVEAIPERADECKRNRPHACVVHAALGPPGSSGTTSFMVPQHDDHQLSAFRENQEKIHEHVVGLEKAGAVLRRVVVPFMTMNDALSQAENAGAISRVDFASIDVEGGELDLLKGFDLSKYQPRVLVIEDLTLGDDSRVAEYVRERGYEQVMWLGANRVLIRRDESTLIQRARRLAETVYSPFVRPGGQPDTAARSLRSCQSSRPISSHSHPH